MINQYLRVCYNFSAVFLKNVGTKMASVGRAIQLMCQKVCTFDNEGSRITLQALYFSPLGLNFFRLFEPVNFLSLNTY